MATWLSNLFQSDKYPQLHSIVTNSDKIKAELDKLTETYPNEASDIINLYQQLNDKLNNLFDEIKQNESQAGGRRTKKSRHSKKTRKSRKSRK